MKRSFIVVLATCALVLAILACNIPVSQGSGQPDYVATITAQVAAIGQSGAQSASAAAPATTGTPSPITAQVKANTNCRMGPGTSYAIVVSLTAGQTVTVVGKDTTDNYWIVTTPDGSGTCWLWGQVSSVTGDTSGLPQMSPSQAPASIATRTPKPTSTPKPTATKKTVSGPLPVAPDHVNASLSSSCTITKTLLGYTASWDVQVNWADSDPSVTHFRIYQGSTLLSTQGVPVNSWLGQGTVTGTYASVKSISFGVQAVNGNGDSAITYDSVTCQ